ncbi:MAG: sulfotransferase family 2 domain-containing protein [Acidimicrobiales bacterium]
MLMGIEVQPEVPGHLLEDPKPLLDADERLIVLWSGKAACTTVLRWTFSRMGLLDAADYFGWIHQFRTKVYYDSRRYRRGIERYQQSRYRHIRVVRDPFSRVVSAYLHSLQQGYERQQISSFLVVDRAYSFRDFVAYLATVDLASHNIHFRWQSTAAERDGELVLDHVVRVEDGLQQRLCEVEQDLGLKATDFVADNIQSKHRSDYSALPTFVGDMVHAPGSRPTVPGYGWFYDDALVRQVTRLYRPDFEMYQYQTELVAPAQKRTGSAA